MSTGALAIGLLAEAIKAGMQIYQAQGMTEQQARELVLRDMDAAATRAGLAELGWQARRRPPIPAKDMPAVLPGGPVNPEDAGDGA